MKYSTSRRGSRSVPESADIAPLAAGTDYEADMKTIADDPETQRWWQVRLALVF